MDKNLELLSLHFPNLDWKSKSNHGARVFTACFCYQWSLLVEVLPNGCIATLVAGTTVIAQSPNEQGKTLEEVLQHIREKWNLIEKLLSKKQ